MPGEPNSVSCTCRSCSHEWTETIDPMPQDAAFFLRRIRTIVCPQCQADSASIDVVRPQS